MYINFIIIRLNNFINRGENEKEELGLDMIFLFLIY